ncbi:MAG: hypothetical protein IJP33_06485 [Firmicutes bacterium]|nr:hypothetical protein [Bacillota bacterium]
METLYNKMGEFIKMEDLLPADEFFAYYKDVIAYLQEKYQDENQENLIKLKAICAIVYQNAFARAKMDIKNRNKFRKIGDKCQFWANAIELRLVKEGLSADEQEQMEQKLWGRDAE